MLLTKKLIYIIIAITIIVITPCNGQKKKLEQKIALIDSLIYIQRVDIALPIIDSILSQKQPISKELQIKAIKLEALVQSQKLETALNLSDEIIKNPYLKDSSFVRTYIERALIYEIAGEFKESKKALDIVKNYYRTFNATKDELYGKYLYRLSSWYRLKNNKEKAFEYAEKARVFGKKNNYINVEASALLILGILNPNPFSEENLAEFKRTIYLYKKIKNYNHISYMYTSLAVNHLKKKEYAKANVFLDSVLIASEKGNDKSAKQYAYNYKSRIYENYGNIKKALYYHKKFKQISDSIISIQQTLQVSEINAKFNYEKEAIKNDTLEQNLTNEKEQKNYLLIGLVILIILLFGIGFSAINLVKKRKEIKRKNVNLTEALDKNKLLLKELNHRVNNNLALILSLVKFQYYEIDNPKYKDKFQSLEHRIKTIAAAHEQLLYSKENVDGEDYDVEEYLSKITNSLIDISTKNVQLNLEAKNINLNIDTMLPIGILINELMSNSLKHAVYKDVLIIDVLITLQQSNIIVIYKDSGATFKEIKNPKSLGVSIINSMVKQLKGTIQRINSEYKISLQLKNSKKMI